MHVLRSRAKFIEIGKLGRVKHIFLQLSAQAEKCPAVNKVLNENSAAYLRASWRLRDRNRGYILRNWF
jgi:hypothetical protein